MKYIEVKFVVGDIVRVSLPSIRDDIEPLVEVTELSIDKNGTRYLCSWLNGGIVNRSMFRDNEITAPNYEDAS